MAATFTIADGNPDIYISNSIWCKRTASTPVGWSNTDAAPPGAFEAPFFRGDNWAWIQVTQLGTVDGDQDAYLHLFAGIEGENYSADEILLPANQFTPADLWPTTSWDEQFLAGKVCRIPWFDGLGTHLTCHVSNVAMRPGPGNSRWYMFKWERHLVPPTTSCTSMRIALLAFVDDNKSVAADFTVSGNAGFSQRNCLIV